uniref:Multiple myeloma tumor-associated protein 2-like N-terminal domain-containing protein n=1 Tax=Hanusia phi TaxID=3032 RepID=A0A7S0E0P5_9CRYP|mmetsp:Transcript_13509/g.31099  ORF Transcript_13509/g.31099 Transcript_13509/m.31099 type:complete len:339 (+) Transcript_13509:105-1121(+)
MAIYNGPARGGTRGGKDKFDWSEIKEKHGDTIFQAQNYLGHSVKAPAGRWQKFKDLNWYVNETKVDLKKSGQSELELVKSREQDLMAQLLGEKPIQRPEVALEKEEKNKLFKKGNAEAGTIADGIASESFGERIEGLGFAPIKVENLQASLETQTHERQEGTQNINEMIQNHLAGDHHGPDDADHAELLASMEAGDWDGLASSRSKSDKKQKKEMKKALKQEKKRLKAEKKEKKRKRESRDRSEDEEWKRYKRAGQEQMSALERRLASASAPRTAYERSRDAERRGDNYDKQYHSLYGSTANPRSLANSGVGSQKAHLHRSKADPLERIAHGSQGPVL